MRLNGKEGREKSKTVERLHALYLAMGTSPRQTFKRHKCICLASQAGEHIQASMWKARVRAVIRPRVATHHLSSA
jgi:hypothetical protein